ncbi:MAG: hypothetical protein GKR94_02435 [Gammaproteobacteria bacterium]|nr:hypothetical protein [Gammaproteobacteria bacterium]
MADWLPLIAHLQAPAGVGVTTIRYDRFSPYFNEADAHGLQLRPYWAYAHVYPLSERDVARQAYFFVDIVADAWYPQRLHTVIAEWGRSWLDQRSGALPACANTAPQLSMRDAGISIEIRDTRPCAVEPSMELVGVDAQVYRACDSSKTMAALLRTVRKSGGQTLEAELRLSVERLQALKILARFGDRLLSLATDEPARPYRGFEQYPGGLALLAGRRREEPEDVVPGDVPLHRLFRSSVHTSVASNDVA